MNILAVFVQTDFSPFSVIIDSETETWETESALICRANSSGFSHREKKPLQ